MNLIYNIIKLVSLNLIIFKEMNAPMTNITIEFNLTEPLYYQIYKAIVFAINQGNIKPLEHLPSKRKLANHLGVSVHTIMNAYHLLLDEGYIQSIEKKGYFVANQEFVSIIHPKTIHKEEEISYQYDLTTQTTEEKSFSYSSFTKCVKETLAAKEYIKKSSLEGLKCLRMAIAEHLRENRGIQTSYQQIIIGNGIEMLEKIFDLLPCQSFGTENPGYHKLSQLLLSKNISIEYLPIDEQGVTIPKNSSILYTTSFNQFPTGIKMSISRKKELINWAIKTNGYIIEDDFDAEYRIGSVPKTALFSLNSERIIFFSSFSSTIFAGFRIAYMVLPRELLSKYLNTFKNHSNPVSSLDQEILYHYITNGDYARHMNRLKTKYIQKRKIIFEILKNNKYIQVEEQKNFLSVLIHIDPSISIETLIHQLTLKKVQIKTIGHYLYPVQPNQTLILGYTNINELELKQVLKILIETIKEIRLA